MSYGVNLHQSQVGKQSISGVATAKVQTDSLNLGFPSAYQSVYASKGVPERFFNTTERRVGGFLAGNDLQAQFHEQKRVDADYMARQRVRSTQNSRMRYCSTPHGLGVRPHAELAQRHFANPSNGALALASGRQTHSDGPFHYSNGEQYVSQYQGGVLRSAQGQAYGKRVLLERIGQLNDIASAKQAFVGPEGMPTSTGAPTQTFAPSVQGVNPAIELNLLLQSIIDALVGSAGDNNKLDKFELTTTTRALGLIFRMTPEAGDDFLEDLMGKLDTILQLLNGSLDDEQASAGMSNTTRETALSLQVLFTKLREYAERMMTGRNLSVPEKIALSKNLVSSLGFSKMLKYASEANDSGLLDEADRARLFSSQQAQRFRVGDMDEEGDESDFDENAPTREDTEHAYSTGVERGDRSFDDDERSRFGMNSGVYFNSQGRGEEAYLGEDAETSVSARSARFAPPPPPSRIGAPDIRGVFDPDTQGFTIANVAPPSAPSTVVPTMAGTPARGGLPTSQSQLPTTREGFTALAKAINDAGGINGSKIQVYSGSSVANIRKNFVKRLGLAGKF